MNASGTVLALPIVLGLCLILGLAAFSSHTAASAQRRLVDRVLARRTLLAAADAAFEEAAAQLEARNGDLPALEPASVLVRHGAHGQVETVLGRASGSAPRQAFALTRDGSVVGLSFDAEAAPAGAVEVLELGRDAGQPAATSRPR